MIALLSEKEKDDAVMLYTIYIQYTCMDVNVFAGSCESVGWYDEEYSSEECLCPQ